MTACIAQDLQITYKIVLPLVNNLNVQNMVKHMMHQQQVCLVLSSLSLSDATCIIFAAKASDECSDNTGCIETTKEVAWLS